MNLRRHILFNTLVTLVGFQGEGMIKAPPLSHQLASARQLPFTSNLNVQGIRRGLYNIMYPKYIFCLMCKALGTVFASKFYTSVCFYHCHHYHLI